MGLTFVCLAGLCDKIRNLCHAEAYKTVLNPDTMTKIEQLQYIENYIGDNLSKDELRELVYRLISDESLRRSFKMFSQE
jgi:hypothetical protein